MRFPTVIVSIAFIAGAVMGIACNSGSTAHRGLDGALDQASGSATGGKMSSGGTSGTGGATGMGGTHGSGGVAGSGGVSGSGGSKDGGGAGGTSVADASADVRIAKSGDPCRSGTDCTTAPPMFLQCLAPGESRGCGTCRRDGSQCATDADCAPDGGSTGAKQICASAPSSECYCTGWFICQPGCRSNADCPSGTGCNSLHACQKTCTSGDGTCPVNYVCSADGFCDQKMCTTDTDCSGACVKGRCYSAPGTCQAMAA